MKPLLNQKNRFTSNPNLKAKNAKKFRMDKHRCAISFPPGSRAMHQLFFVVCHSFITYSMVWLIIIVIILILIAVYFLKDKLGNFVKGGLAATNRGKAEIDSIFQDIQPRLPFSCTVCHKYNCGPGQCPPGKHYYIYNGNYICCHVNPFGEDIFN